MKSTTAQSNDRRGTHLSDSALARGTEHRDTNRNGGGKPEPMATCWAASPPPSPSRQRWVSSVLRMAATNSHSPDPPK